MSKIGLKVTKISSGVQEILTINGGEWTRKVVDIRPDIKALSGRALEEGRDVLMLSFVPSGSLLTLFHTISGRGGDLVSAWIFIPNNCAVTADEELALLQRVSAELSKSQVNDWTELETMLSKEYPQKDAFPLFESPQTAPCAARYFGTGTDYQLKEMLGENIYQREYQEHKYIFLLDRSCEIVAADSLKNYTNAPLLTWILVNPPQLPAGITAKLDEQDFKTPLPAFIGQKSTLALERIGFRSLQFAYTVNRNPIVLPDMDWKMEVSARCFHVEDEEHNDITGQCQFQLNGHPFGHSPVYLSEADAMRQSQLVISCSGYEDFRGAVTLSGARFPMPFTLRKRRQEVVYFINGVECPNLKECPPLYEETNTQNVSRKKYCYCAPSPKALGSWWKIVGIACIVLALLLGMLAGGLGYRYFLADKLKKDEPKKEVKKEGNLPVPPAVGIPAPQTKTYACLNKDTWLKEEMEAEEDLKGLFDDLKSMNFKNLQEKWVKSIDPTKNPKWSVFIQQIGALAASYPVKFASGSYPYLKGYCDKVVTKVSYTDYYIALEKDLNPAAVANTGSAAKTGSTANKSASGINNGTGGSADM